MICNNSLVRQAMLVALLLLPSKAMAEVRAIFDTVGGTVHVSGLDATRRGKLLGDPSNVFFQHSTVQSRHSMAFSVAENKDTLVIKPRFKLRPGANYLLRLELGEVEKFETTVSVQTTRSAPPELVWHAPHNTLIPQNTLRLYFMFSEPMAKGQIRDAIRLERTDGTIVHSPFLNLAAELWDREQRRLTLLFDPGRLKQGVGPNRTDGAPLQAGQNYVLVISGTMKSADGEHIDKEVRLPLAVGSAERRALDPDNWQINAAKPGSKDPLVVHFDRLMDRGASTRLITVVDPSGNAIAGKVENDGYSWQFTPNNPWRALARLRIDPGLEDVCGNTMRAPFDANPGTIGKRVEAVEFEIY